MRVQGGRRPEVGGIDSDNARLAGWKLRHGITVSGLANLTAFGDFLASFISASAFQRFSAHARLTPRPIRHLKMSPHVADLMHRPRSRRWLLATQRRLAARPNGFRTFSLSMRAHLSPTSKLTRASNMRFSGNQFIQSRGIRFHRHQLQTLGSGPIANHFP